MESTSPKCDQFHFLVFLFLPASLGQVLSREEGALSHRLSAPARGIKPLAGRLRGLRPAKVT